MRLAPEAFGRNFVISARNLLRLYEQCGRPAGSEENVKKTIETICDLGLDSAK